MITEQRIAIYLQAASTTRVGVSGSLSYAFFYHRTKEVGWKNKQGEKVKRNGEEGEIGIGTVSEAQEAIVDSELKNFCISTTKLRRFIHLRKN